MMTPPTAAPAAMHLQSEADIIQFRERLFFPEERRMFILDELSRLLVEPPRHRTKSIAIIGSANSGKSRLISRFLRLHPHVEHDTYTEIPAVSVSCAQMKQVEQLSGAILRRIGTVHAEKGTHAQRVERLLDQAQKRRLRMILLDEFHDPLKTPRRAEDFLMFLKGMLNEGLLVVPVGTEVLEGRLNADPQLATRFNFKLGRLTDVTDPRVVKALLLALAQVDGQDISDDLVRYVIAEAAGNLGNMADWVELCLRRGKPVTFKNMQGCRDLLSF